MLTKEYLAQIGGWAVLKEAGALVQAGRIASVSFDGNELSGQLRLATGTLTSRMKLGVRLADVENFCPCRQAREHGVICPHAIALGLAWIAKGNHAAAPASSAPAVPARLQEAPIPVSRIVAAGEAGETVALAVSFLFPLQFAEAWRSGKLRVILEADGLPWDAAVKGRHALGPLPVNDEAADALRLLERREGGRLPGIVPLAAADFDAFFLSLAGAPRLGLGKKSVLAVRRAAAKPRVRVTTQDDGRTRVEWLGDGAAEGGEWLPSRQGRWRFTGDALEFHPLASPVLQRLAAQPLLLSAAEVPHFLQLPSLADQVEVELCPLSGKIEWREARPRLHADLDGTLQGLGVRLEARYGTHAVLLSGPAFSAPKTGDPGRWLPDPANPRLYLGRHGAAETRARAELAAAGFASLPKQADRHGLSGEPAVISFLANHLPEWRRQWSLELSPRLQALLAQCEVVEPRVAIRVGGASGDEWLTLDTEFRSASGNAAVSLSPGEVQQLLQTGRSHKKLPNGRIALLPARAVAAWQEVLTDCDPEAGLTGARIGRNHAPYLEEALRESGIVQTGGQPWTAPKRLREIAPLPLPAALEPVLRPYQKEGVAWLHGLAENGFAGILADEMGLGKTIQVLAWLAARHAAGKKEPALVVAPTSLLVNWQREAERFAPGLRVAVLHGSERHGTWENLGDYDLLVTSYALLRRDIEKYRDAEFGVAVLDEAQHIKNRSSQNAQAAKELRAKHRVILTGTPLENSLLDLWSMFDFLMPGYLGPAKAFRERYEVPVVRGGDDGASLKRLRQRVHPFLLRRTKADVAAEIPARLDNVVSCDLSPEQKEVYQAVLEQGRRDVFEHSGKQGNPGKRTMAMLTALTRLRQACCHLGLLPLDRPAPWKEPSAKLDSLFEIVSEAVDGGHRLLVFSQFVKLLRLIEERLKKEETAYCYLDGATVDRQAEIDRFQNTPSIPVFLISLKAGGSGLNLTGADTVVHCDPWWNPAVEEQATARAHRIGQTKVVTSYKLIARGTVEEKIVQLQEKKRLLAEQTLAVEGEGAFLSRLTQEEWEDLLAG